MKQLKTITLQEELKYWGAREQKTNPSFELALENKIEIKGTSQLNEEVIAKYNGFKVIDKYSLTNHAKEEYLKWNIQGTIKEIRITLDEEYHKDKRNCVADAFCKNAFFNENTIELLIETDSKTIKINLDEFTRAIYGENFSIHKEEKKLIEFEDFYGADFTLLIKEYSYV